MSVLEEEVVAEFPVLESPVTDQESCSLDNYLVLPDHSMDERIAEARRKLGKSTILLGHHYQRDEVIRFADYTGDSYKLSKVAAETEAKYLIFCGVHFMAESADILGRPDDPPGTGQQVILPDLNAGCSMADMAEIGQVEACWDTLLAAGIDPGEILPLTYMNSTAAIKAFCGERGGSGLHLIQRPKGIRVGLLPRGKNPLPARSAPRPQHRLRYGHPDERDGRLRPVSN